VLQRSEIGTEGRKDGESGWNELTKRGYWGEKNWKGALQKRAVLREGISSRQIGVNSSKESKGAYATHDLWR